ncbi:hypothetical protein V499_04487 [Pseudogymnoascus sp. VKM F-103]|nr:hypothetical protein V499_04487 [Pseudogymnoascus sp. VKM F-103]
MSGVNGNRFIAFAFPAYRMSLDMRRLGDGDLDWGTHGPLTRDDKGEEDGQWGGDDDDGDDDNEGEGEKEEEDGVYFEG